MKQFDISLEKLWYILIGVTIRQQLVYVKIKLKLK